MEFTKLLAGLLAAALALPAAAQTQAALAVPDRSTPAVSLKIRRIVPEVQMVFSAEDHHRRPVLDLSASQIRVLDNGVAAPLTSFYPAEGLPLRIALLLDASESMRPGFAAALQAAGSFLERVERTGNGRIFTMAFAATDATGSDAEAALSGRKPGGETALYDALIAACARLRSNPPARRALLLLSDGEDNYSQSTLREAIAALQQADVAVYSATAHSRRVEYPGDRVLRQIAAATGGQAFFLRTYAQADAIFAQVENQLRAQYVVGFRPIGSTAEREFHAVKVVAPGVVIHARPGYYAKPDNSD